MHINKYEKWKEGEGRTVCTLDEWLENGHMLTWLKRAHTMLLTWLKRAHNQSCLLDWKGRTLKVAYLIEKGAWKKLLSWLKRAHTQRCFLDWKGRTLKVCFLDWKGRTWFWIQTVWTRTCKKVNSPGGWGENCWWENISDSLNTHR